MDFVPLFLDPQGRLAPRRFGQAYILLTAAMLFITALIALTGPGIAILQYALVFPYICVFGKRLHDAGLSAWLWLAFLAGYFVINMIVTMVFMPGLAPEAYAIQQEVQVIMQEKGLSAGMEETARRTPEITRLTGHISVLAFLAGSAITGFTAYKLKSDPSVNRFGPPVA